ncbi:hypothetical protein CRG98_021240 [Punica granatum]|uniref:Uncharacterized protein n=1 Tax=Punica granatum TaxID=22663 RepID=A0A2I0JPZ6_PUNGR|nr:hypothetical protein CRG98_021240 [Punica granatum]
MAIEEGTLSPNTSSLISLLLLLFLISIPLSMEEKEESLPITGGRIDSNHHRRTGARRHRLMVGTANSPPTSRSGLPHVSLAGTVRGRRNGRGREGPRVRRRSPSLPWQDKIFNASEHEVPSGPNPISNR